GFVLGVDLAMSLLTLARAKACDRKLRNIEFCRGDMLNLPAPDSHFDSVVCVFGIFFVPDMPSAVRELWRVVRPGGTLAVTTWGPNLLETATTAFWKAIREVRPDLFKGFNPWDRISDPQSVRALLQAGGVDQVEAVAEAGTHPIPSPAAWCSAVRGTGYRGTLEQLDADDLERVRKFNENFIRQADIHSVETNVVYAIATKAQKLVGRSSVHKVYHIRLAKVLVIR